MNVDLAIVVPSAQRTGGGDLWLEGLLRYLPRLGVSPLVLFDQPGELVTTAGAHGCRAGVATGAALVGALREHLPAATVFWSPRAQIYGTSAHRAAGCPGRTAWVQHVMPSTFSVHRDAATLPSDAVICVSSRVAGRHIELYPTNRTHVVHPGIDPVPAMAREQARALLGVPKGGPVVGVVGRVEPWKGQDVAVRMLALLRVPDVRLVLIGARRSPTWPDFEPLVAALARDLGVADRVLCTGHLSDASAALPGLDVLLSSSREEGFGLSLVEAMAARTPVVATRCGGPEDIIDDGRTGLLVAPENPYALAAAVERLFDSAPLAQRLSAAAHASWQTRFTAAASAERFLAAVAATAA
jgi:glycosyltransferase involved in cell wall biosynthesis